MTGKGDDEDIFVRGKWAPHRYQYNPHNPIGLALIIGTLLMVLVSIYLLRRSSTVAHSGPDTWDGAELRSAVTAATTELSARARSGPGDLDYEETLRTAIAAKGHRSYGALTVVLTTDPVIPAPAGGHVERADYNVSADGTDTEFCLKVNALEKKRATGYDRVTISVHTGMCAA
jgi:hypothetical protein